MFKSGVLATVIARPSIRSKKLGLILQKVEWKKREEKLTDHSTEWTSVLCWADTQYSNRDSNDFINSSSFIRDKVHENEVFSVSKKGFDVKKRYLQRCYYQKEKDEVIIKCVNVIIYVYIYLFLISNKLLTFTILINEIPY